VLGKPERYFAAGHVRYAWVDDRIVILDLRTESYFALDPTASSMWRELTAPYAADAGLRRLEQRYVVEPAQLAADFHAFTRRCVEAEWLVDVEPVPPPRPRAGGRRRGRWPLTLQAWWTLLAITRSLAARGFASTYARLSRPESAKEIRADAQDELLSTAMRAFSRARAVCLFEARAGGLSSAIAGSVRIPAVARSHRRSQDRRPAISLRGACLDRASRPCCPRRSGKYQPLHRDRKPADMKRFLGRIEGARFRCWPAPERQWQCRVLWRGYLANRDDILAEARQRHVRLRGGSDAEP
jgi:hypothetical protein